jgi:hypothetical protein
MQQLYKITTSVANLYSFVEGQIWRVENGRAPKWFTQCAVPVADVPDHAEVRVLDVRDRERRTRPREIPAPPKPLTAADLRAKFGWSDEQLDAARRCGLPKPGYVMKGASLFGVRDPQMVAQWDVVSIETWAARRARVEPAVSGLQRLRLVLGIDPARVCPECGASWVATYAERRRYRLMGLTPRRRCGDCCKARRRARRRRALPAA